MKFRTRLALAFTLHFVLLAVLLIYHVRTSRQAVSTGYELSEISTRIYGGATEQLGRIAQLDENAAKYKVTRDAGYLEKFDELFAEFDAELATLGELQLSAREHAALSALDERWSAFRPVAQSLDAMVGPAAFDGEAALAVVQALLDDVRDGTLALGEASQHVMLERLHGSALRAQAAERISWAAAAVALLLSALVSILIVRTLAGSLHTLKRGTQEVARGRFDYRLDTSRDDEFAAVARDFNAMAARLGELDRMKRDFISKMSHDLKTPLASMQETIAVMRDELAGPLTERQQRLLALNHESGERLSAMLAKLLDLSSLEAGLHAPECAVHELDAIAARAAELADSARAGTARAGAVRVDMPDHRVLLECDGDRVRQVLDNLLENAAKFAPDPSDIDIRLRTHDERPADVPAERWAAVRRSARGAVAQIVVCDRGPGIDAAHKEAIFDRFVQSAAGRAARNRGVGLGLTICREIVTAHGGVIWEDGTPGEGARFRILLPGALRYPEAPAPSAAEPADLAALEPAS